MARKRNGLVMVGLALAGALAIGAYWALQHGRDDAAADREVAANAKPGRIPGEPLRPPAAGDAAPAGEYREIGWEALVPAGWDPMAPLRGLDLAQMEDDDPRAQEALDKAKRYWNEAPIESSLDGAPVKLPGFVVSLGGEGEAIREFLLVPYFGACVHLPPPPVNQVVHVKASLPLAGIRTMDTVWIEGVLRVERAETMMGDSGYAMRGAKVSRYHEARQ